MAAHPHRRTRLAAGGAAGLLLLLPLAACSSDNVDCSGTTCSVSLSGDGATASILGNECSIRFGRHRSIATIQIVSALVALSIGLLAGGSPHLLLALVLLLLNSELVPRSGIGSIPLYRRFQLEHVLHDRGNASQPEQKLLAEIGTNL